MLLATTVRDAFAGRWRIERRVTNLRDGAEGRLTGWAAFDAVNRIILYREEGVLEMYGRRSTETHALRIKFVTPGRVEVFFQNRAFFHAFDPREDSPTAEHVHKGARYRIRYDFHRPWEWRVVWRVTSAGKDVRSETRFRR